jgi:hypothetical protein
MCSGAVERLSTGGTAAPIDDLGLIDLVPSIIGDLQTRRRPQRAIDVDRLTARSTDQVVVVVPHTMLITSGRSGWLDTPQEALAHQNAESVVHPLTRDGTDLASHRLGHLVGGAVGLIGHGPQDGQTLGRDLDAVPAKQIGVAVGRLH